MAASTRSIYAHNFIQQTIAGLNPPAPYVPQWFHKALADLDGLNEFGEPKWKLVWGGSETHFSIGRTRIKYPIRHKDVPVGWEIWTGRWTKNGKVYKYPGRRGKITRFPETRILPITCANDPKYPTGRLVYDWLDIGKPRFIVEEWCAPEVACDGWEEQQFGTHPRTGEWCDILGPRPERGLYRGFMTLETDDGQYRPPDEATLNWLRSILYLRNQDPVLYSPRERPPQHVIEARLRKRYDEIRAFEAREAQELEQRMFDRMMVSVRRQLNPNPNEGGTIGGHFMIHNPRHGTTDWNK
jgi:hypothetical protein